jgi:tRNA pseudouridine38-40 synthase
MQRLKLTLEYDGTDFVGWARQPGLRTVEAELREALRRVFASFDELIVAGRTDAGVHALGQAVSVAVGGRGPATEHAAAALNAVLPSDVAVLSAEDVPDDFNARFSASGRSYRYRVLTARHAAPLRRARVHHYPRPLDEHDLDASAAVIVGEHDFEAFTKTKTHHDSFICTVRRATWRRTGDELIFEIDASRFLRHMIRSLVGTMLEQSPEDIRALLASGNRNDAGTTAPGRGLYLVSVAYD